MFLNYAAHAGIVAKNFTISNLGFCQATGWQKKQISNNPIAFRSVGMSEDGKYQTFTAASGAGTTSNPSRTYPFVSSDYGNTWKQITGNTSVLPYWHDNIGQTVKVFKDGRTQMVVGTRAGNNSGPFLFNISYDYGNTWSVFTSSPHGLGFFDASHDYKVMALVGLFASSKLYVTHNSGVTWFEAGTEVLTEWGDISISYDGQYMLARQPRSIGAVVASSDSGISWRTLSLPNPGFISWIDPEVSKNGDIQFIADSNGADIYRSTDYGDSWVRVLDRPVFDTWESIRISDNNKYCLASSNGAPIYRSKNSGINWEVINLNQYYSNLPAFGGVALSKNGKYQTIIPKPSPSTHNSIYINCNFGLDPGQVADVECFEGLSNYSVEAVYIHDHNSNSEFPESTSLCRPASNVTGDNSIEILTPYSPTNFIPQDAVEFFATVILPSPRESQIDVEVQTVLKPGGIPLIDISYDGFTFGQSTVIPITEGEVSNTFIVRITGSLPEDDPLIPGTNTLGEIFLEANVPTDLSYDPSLTLLTIYPGGGGNGEAAPCGGPGHVCNRATFDIIIGTRLNEDRTQIENGIQVLQANLNNGGGILDPGPGPFPYDGQYDRYSSGIITPQMSEQIFGPSHNDGMEKSYFVEIRPSEGNDSPHNGVTNVRIRDCSGALVYNCCLGLGGGTNFTPVPDPSSPTTSAGSFMQVLNELPQDFIKSLNDLK